MLRECEVDYDSDDPRKIAEVLIRKVPDDQQVSGLKPKSHNLLVFHQIVSQFEACVLPAPSHVYIYTLVHIFASFYFLLFSCSCFIL